MNSAPPRESAAAFHPPPSAIAAKQSKVTTRRRRSPYPAFASPLQSERQLPAKRTDVRLRKRVSRRAPPRETQPHRASVSKPRLPKRMRKQQLVWKARQVP